MRKRVALLVALSFTLAEALAPLTPATASEWLEDEAETLTKLSDLATDFAEKSKKVSPFTKAFAESAKKLKGFLEGTLTTVTDKTLYDPAWFEYLDEQRVAMNKTMPPDLPSLNAKGAYQGMVGPPEQATYMSGEEELRILDEVGQERGDTIAKLKTNRDELQKFATQFKAEAGTAMNIGDGLNKVIEKYPNIDVAFAFTGVNGYVSLTALGWNEEVIPAFNDRETAATNAVNRYNKAIAAAEADLKTFNTLKSSLRSIWGGIDTQALNPAGIDMNPGAVTKLQAEAADATARARATAAELQKEAADISKHDAGISRIQNFLALARSASDIASASSADSDADATNKTTVVKSKTVINNRTTVIFHVVPGAYLEQERRGQTPIERQR